jgi:2-oxoglutarate ferredoxin oxidoreductase subunit alpha
MEKIINDFTINIATANGTGSQSANLILLNSLFRMGTHVSGKNLFPSNIAGLPTWYIVRVSDHGYQAPGDETNIQVIMNIDTWAEDLAGLKPGTVVICNTDVKAPIERKDLIIYPAPMTSMARKLNPKLAKMVSNMVYVGIMAEMLEIPQNIVEEAISKQFNGKEKAIEINSQASIMGREYFRDNCEKNDPYYVEARDKNEKRFLIEGNEALALGCVYGGINMLSWYPITPSSSVAEGIEAYVDKLRIDKYGKKTCAVVQAEDELAAVGMVLGAGWAGARGMTCTSGPGISLMSELIGLSYYSEIPGVIWDVARVGPSTGLPTRTQQGDISMLYEASHGDTQHIVLIPGNVDECFEFGWKAFDYAEKYQTMVFGFTDLDLGMNQWSSNGFEYPNEPMNRGKVIRTKEEMDKIKNYGRYRDLDGDGIPYRTLPGSGLKPILSRGTGHDEDGVYSEKAHIYRDNMTRLKRKIENSRGDLPQPILREENELDVGIIYYGSMENTIQEIDDILESTGMKVSQCRVRALPLSLEVDEFVRRHDKVIVLEVNRDGQMYGILRKEIATELVPKLYSVAFSDGLPPKAAEYAEAIIGTLESFEVA